MLTLGGVWTTLAWSLSGLLFMGCLDEIKQHFLLQWLSLDPCSLPRLDLKIVFFILQSNYYSGECCKRSLDNELPPSTFAVRSGPGRYQIKLCARKRFRWAWRCGLETRSIIAYRKSLYSLFKRLLLLQSLSYEKCLSISRARESSLTIGSIHVLVSFLSLRNSIPVTIVVDFRVASRL